ncbi:MAG: SDR family oxidoreductase [Methanobacteriota archaeon]
MAGMAGMTRSPYRADLFAGKKVLVTGGGTGLGRAMALAYAAHGADVALFSRKKENLDAVAKEVGALGKKSLVSVGDVRVPDDVARCADGIRDAWGGLDVLVNNAAGNFLVTIENMSENAWKAVTGIVLDGTFRVSKACLPLLEARKGNILNIVTTYAERSGAPMVAHSGAAKAGVLNFTRTCAVEWSGRGIRANAIAPGPVPTEGAFSRLVVVEGAKERMMQKIPLGRLGTEEDIANAALFLTSNELSGWITGDCLVVDGGQWLAHPMFEM